MRRSFRGALALVLVTLWPASQAPALFKTRLELKKLLDGAQGIFEARITRTDEAKSRFVVSWAKDLKGRSSLAQLNVVIKNLKRKDDEQKLFKRIRAGLPVVVFASKERKATRIFFFTEGSWFSMVTTVPLKARAVDAPKPAGKAACRFDACEIYLRRTYSGKTQELLDLIPDVRKGKRKAPSWQGKLKPGLGPELPPPREKRDPDARKKP